MTADETNADLDADALEELERLQTPRKRRNLFQGVLSVAMLLTCLIFILLRLRGLNLVIFPLSITAGFASLFFLIDAVRTGRKIDRQFGKLDRCRDARAIGPLALGLSNGMVDQALTTRSLTVLLPGMTSEVAAALDTSQRRALFRSLQRDPRENADYLIALLGALPHIADPAALPYLSQLIARTRWDRSLQRLHHAATVCEAALQEAAIRQKPAATLLRAARANPDLLRPAPSVDTVEEVLLRATGGEEFDNG